MTERKRERRALTAPGTARSYSLMEVLGRAIVSGVLSIRGTLTEAELCRQLGASRTAVREVVKMLTAKGLLHARPEKGTWISEPEDWILFDPDVFAWLVESDQFSSLLDEFAQLRLAVEPLAAAIVAASATAEHKQAIRDSATRAAVCGDGDLVALHIAILKASGNRFFIEIGKLIQVRQHIEEKETWPTRRDSNEEFASRMGVAEAIVAGDPTVAKSAMRELLLSTPFDDAHREPGYGAAPAGDRRFSEIAIQVQ